jgi:hypothetical protein
MGAKIRPRLSAIASLSNLSVRFADSRRGSIDRERWLEARRDIEALCGELRRGDDLELILKALEAGRHSPDGGISLLSGEMAKVKRKSRSGSKKKVRRAIHADDPKPR